ncbi:MAG: hypothetical protein LBR81_00655 [Prevotellaceae bacterium]|jgi:hypothetical protein|nr:hypothetical protein [Prevotellaceae bacterium]
MKKQKQAFPCKVEELPVAGEFLLQSVNRDLSDFKDFSPVFTEEYLRNIEKEVAECREMVNASVLDRELKLATGRLKEKCTGLRVLLNKLEVYLLLSDKELTVTANDFRLKELRYAISKKNVEVVLAVMRRLLLLAKQNIKVLVKKGMTKEVILELQGMHAEINSLNMQQKELLKERSALRNRKQFYDLWESLQVLLKTGQAMYKEIDVEKLKDYTMTQLVKRVHAEQQEYQLI